ncbi:hypothetical protein ABW19_dt0207287 [Dactylella cylindrospora]|nr:hypothetical protein ABW19_dt0207287 [Dactylella cylindrospora]
MSSSSRSTTATEVQILNNFLLSRATLPDIIDLKTFRSLFPKNLQEHAQVKHLYNHLSLKRTAMIEDVRKNIEFEAKMSHQLLKRERRENEAQNRDDDAEMRDYADMGGVMEIYGEMPAPKTERLPLNDMIKILEEANESLEIEMATLDEDCEKLTKEIEEIVGGLSSLKFGKLTGTNEGLVDNVIEDLSRLQETCDRVLKPDE